MSEQNSLCFLCLEKVRTKFPVFPVSWPPCLGFTTITQVLQDFTNNFYRSPTKLRDDYVFSHVCLSVILLTGRWSHAIIAHHGMMHGTSLYNHPQDMFKLMKHVRLASGQLASCRNAFLLQYILLSVFTVRYVCPLSV